MDWEMSANCNAMLRHDSFQGRSWWRLTLILSHALILIVIYLCIIYSPFDSWNVYSALVISDLVCMEDFSHYTDLDPVNYQFCFQNTSALTEFSPLLISHLLRPCMSQSGIFGVAWLLKKIIPLNYFMHQPSHIFCLMKPFRRNFAAC